MLHQLKKSKLFLGGAILCGILVIVGVLGYAITEDPTPNANQIVPEWSNLGPGTTVYYSQEASSESTPDSSEVGTASESQNPTETSNPSQAQNSTETPSYLYWALGNPNTPKIIPLKNNPTANPGAGMEADDSAKMVDKVYNSRTFWLGSDRFGRDILSRMIIGARISLSIGFFAMIASLFIGVIIGISSGYYGGKIDAFFSWLITVFWSVPTLLIALGLSMVFGKGYYQVLLATALSTWVEVARVVRGQTLQLKQREFILAAKITGFSNARIMFKHILPNLKGSLTVLATTNFASAILLEAGLGFLGLGVAPPTPSWGMMVKENLGYLVLDNSYLALVPGIAIMILVMAFNLMSMGLRDALDPYTKDS
jgi:peptide/nickel transport system permease protein